MRLVLILNNMAHWVFEAEEIPTFPPMPDGEIPLIVDITNMPEVQEGWLYDASTDTFTKPPPPEPGETPEPMPDIPPTYMVPILEFFDGLMEGFNMEEGFNMATPTDVTQEGFNNA